MATIREFEDSRGRGWEVRWRNPSTGRQARRRKRDRTIAKKLYAEAVNIEAYGRDVPVPRRDISVAEAVERWRERTYPGLEPKTRSGYDSALNHLPRTIMERKLTVVTSAEVREVLDKAKMVGKTTRTAEQLKSALNGIWKLALVDGLVNINVVAPVSIGRRVSADPEDDEVRDEVDVDDIVSPDDAIALSRAIAPRYRVLVLVLAWLGLRPSECAGLRVRDIDAKRRKLKVRVSRSFAAKRHSVTGEYGEIRPTKNRKRRTIPIPAFLVGDLADLCTGKAPDDLVFTSPRGKRLNIDNWRKNHFNPAASRLGLEVTPRWLRHTAASILIEEGKSPTVVSRILGHSNVAITLGIYAGLWEGRLEDAADSMDEAFLKAGGEPSPRLRLVK